MYISDGILLTLKNKLNSDTCYKIDKTKNIVLGGIRQIQKDKYYMIPLI